MARRNYIADSNESEIETVEPPNSENFSRHTPKLDRMPESASSSQVGESIQNSTDAVQADGNTDETADEQVAEDESEDAENTIVVMVPGPKNPDDFVPYQEDDTVNSVLEELTGSDGETLYRVEYEDERQGKITLNRLSHLPNGNSALDIFNSKESSESISVDMPLNSDRSMSSRRTHHQPTNKDFVDISNVQLSSDSDDEYSTQNGKMKRHLVKRNMSTVDVEKARRSTRGGSRQSSSRLISDNDEDDEDGSQSELTKPNGHGPKRATRSAAPRRANTSANYLEQDEDELAADVQIESEGSDIAYAKPKRPRTSNTRAATSNSNKRGRPQNRGDESDDSSEWSKELPSRTSGRGNKTHKSMKERDIDEELFADEVAGKGGTPKIISIREIYQPVSAGSDFSLFHDQNCDVCGGTGKNSNKGRSELIYCQGCSSSIHRLCLGYRAGREHMVTKVGHENFVMQCRRCIGLAVKKDPLAPRLGACSSCNEPGPSCAAFSVKKSAKQEEKLREENDGDDPITNVREGLVNNPNNVLFRCRGCQRGFHFEHLPLRLKKSTTPQDTEQLRSQRLKRYSKNWQCKECSETTAKLQTLVAWRLSDRKSYAEGDEFDAFREDEKEYLVKWDDKSYFQCSWMPGAWVWGVAAGSMRKAFIRRDEGANLFPKWDEEEAIPEEFLRMEIVFDVEYDVSFQPKSEAYDKAHIDDVVQVLVKFRGLTYDESVWEEPPSPDVADRWSDFVSAYNEYVMGKYFKQSPASALKERIDAFRSLNFQKKVVLKKQPASLIGGEMMGYQMDGLNWLLYNFHQQKNIILADEMGLGKTIQIISLIVSLVKDKPKCWPFLVVTPNSTCPNWRREIKKWAPDLRVVAYYGAKSAREMAMKYELYPNGCSDLRAHVVVTSYEAPVDDSSRAFFKKVKWAGMIVDEGQRLKNDGNLLYGALTALKVPFQVLLTGTPLQNNKRELFNLLQFLDGSIDAAKLDEKYAELTKENLPELHKLIRPFFLRRTKREVLKFLPPMAQVILPVTMSVVQKRLYKSILAKNPKLIMTILGQTKNTLRPTERGNLNNILMQLRKCLCHPFLYSSAVEETSLSQEALHRNLIDASSKFKLLELMLPKLQARGHRVLIFSQFLNQLDLVEDFLNGLGLPFQRLDGTVSTLEKQKRIDAFNAPNSPLFAFLLSTRAGGVGINLATADTVIIMDPDFNPHQDIQALSRAHRIGQTKKVLVFQLMTKDSAEEKIVQIGRKKMALDQALIESMDAQTDAGIDLESILKHGAEALFLNDDRNDIHYDSASVDKLLDRAQVETTDTNDDKTAESQFSHARVWAQGKGALSDDVEDPDADSAAPNESVWLAILKQREADAALEAAKNMQTFGRGKRARQTVDYEKSQPELMDLDDPEDSPQKNGRRARKPHSDDEFPGHGAKESEAEESDAYENVDPRELDIGLPGVKGMKSKSPVYARQSSNKSKRKMDAQGGNKPRLGSLTLTIPSPKKSGKQQQGSKKQPDSSVMKKPDSSVIKPRKPDHKNLLVKSIRGEDTKPFNGVNSSFNLPAIDVRQKLAHLQNSETVKKQASTKAFLDKPNSQANASNRPVKGSTISSSLQNVTSNGLPEPSSILSTSAQDSFAIAEKIDNYIGDHQGRAVSFEKCVKDYEQWSIVNIGTNRVFITARHAQEWHDQGHRLFEDFNRLLQHFEQSAQKEDDIEEECRIVLQSVRSEMDKGPWLWDQVEQKAQRFWPEPQSSANQQYPQQLQATHSQDDPNPSYRQQLQQVHQGQQGQNNNEQRKRGPYKKRENQGAAVDPSANLIQVPDVPLGAPSGQTSSEQKKKRPYKKRKITGLIFDLDIPENMERAKQDYYQDLQQQIIEAQAREARELQEQGRSHEIPRFPPPLPIGTSSQILSQHISIMTKPLSGPSGQHAEESFQLDSDTKPSSPVIRSTPAIEVPVKRKRGRPSGSTSSQPNYPVTLAPMPPMSIRPNVHSCPHCNFVYTRLVPSCPCNAPTTAIRLMLDNLKGIKDDPKQVADAAKLLKEALASKLGPRKPSQK
ncbi:hypothetical protein SBOR_7042 [Sclerotinia borealis F-4128]|uniref:Chromatin remodeling factor mit1 n=1 Tax=Sclerotinia borealis (strain F-4128) TaxID=1432307 RepID=W9C742_SCLBF|nr:hypothetical protein SBOR_7042 [Sclerotinia borealis F-4128]